jgi:hypothetical protein
MSSKLCVDSPSGTDRVPSMRKTMSLVFQLTMTTLTPGGDMKFS